MVQNSFLLCIFLIPILIKRFNLNIKLLCHPYLFDPLEYCWVIWHSQDYHCGHLHDLECILNNQSVLLTLWSSAQSLALCFREPFTQAFKPLCRHLFILLYFINWEIDQIQVKWHIEVNSRLLEEPGKDITLDSLTVITQITTFLQKTEIAYEWGRQIKEMIFPWGILKQIPHWL